MFANNENNMQTFGTREERGKAIAEMGNQIIRIDEHSYKVKSQTSNVIYNVILTEIGWKCSCLDHVTRGVKCKHIQAVEFSFEIRKQIKKIRIEPITSPTACVFCHSSNIVKDGVRHNDFGDVQRYLCNDCSKRFALNSGFEGMKSNPQIITSLCSCIFRENH